MKEKKRICILQNGLSRGGTDTFVVNLCRGLDKCKYDIVVVNPNAKTNIREADIIDAGATLIHTTPLQGIGKIKHLLQLYKILKEGKFDIFQTNVDLFNGPNLMIAWLAGVPIRCCHSHNTMQQKALVEGQTYSIRLYQKAMRWLCWKFSNRRSGCSKDAMNFLFLDRDWYNAQYPTVVNNGIDLNIYKNNSSSNKLKEELGLKAQYHIATVGRIIPQKNPLFIAESFAQLCKKRNDVDFVWVGVGNLEAECRKILVKNKCLDRVHFLGFRKDIPQILSCCDLFFMPSAFEGLGIVIIEAQAAGLPCLVSDVVPNEANCGGVKYKSLNDNIDSWTQAMSDILDQRIHMKIDQRKLYNFSIEHMVKQMEQIFQS